MPGRSNPRTHDVLKLTGVFYTTEMKEEGNAQAEDKIEREEAL